MSAKRYVKKPVEVDAILWTGGDSTPEVLAWIGEGGGSGWSNNADHLAIKTLEGVMEAAVGDYIIRGTKGEHYPCKPEVFADVYKPAGDSETNAEILGSYQRNLLAESVEQDVVNDLVRDAGMRMHQTRLYVSAPPA